MTHDRSDRRPPAPPSAPTRREALRRLAALTAASALAGCGGGGGGGSGDAAAPVPAPVPPPAPPPAPGVAGPAWSGFGGDAQHTALGAVATMDLNRIAWSAPLDLAPQYRDDGALLIHYGSPVVTSNNTVIVAVKTGAAGGFRFEARAGASGALVWSLDGDYLLPPHNWVPSCNLALGPANRLYAPAAGGRLLLRDTADTAGGALRRAAFYGDAAYAAAPAAFDASVYISTPLTVDAQGNAYFGFIATGANPAGLSSGIARLGADGSGSWIGAAAAAGDAATPKPVMNCAPALSPDAQTLYIAVNADPQVGDVQRGYLLALDARTLAVKARAALTDPLAGTPARLSDDGTASPTIGPDGDVYFGVLETRLGTHNGRGWLLHFDAALAPRGAPGGFGWDDTASIVPAAMLPAYAGPSAYLLMTKYDNYAGAGSGDGLNRCAVLDPNATQADAISALAVMREVLTILGPTFESGSAGPVKEWCINTAAVDPLTRSVLVNSEDGFLYRWDLPGNRFTQRIRLTSGIAESYTPTAIGADGAVYAVNNAVLFSIAR